MAIQPSDKDSECGLHVKTIKKILQILYNATNNVDIIDINIKNLGLIRAIFCNNNGEENISELYNGDVFEVKN